MVPTLAEVERLALSCTACSLAEGRTNVVFGVGNVHADLMFVGEAPGRDEDLQGEPFVGRSGKLLDRLIWEETGLTRDHFYVANTTKCRPPGNRDPKPEEVATCRPFLDRQLELIDPRVVVTLGNFATRLLLETTEGITKVRGKMYPKGGRLIVPTFHPSAALQGGANVVPSIRADLVRAKRALDEAA